MSANSPSGSRVPPRQRRSDGCTLPDDCRTAISTASKKRILKVRYATNIPLALATESKCIHAPLPLLSTRRRRCRRRRRRCASSVHCLPSGEQISRVNFELRSSPRGVAHAPVAARGVRRVAQGRLQSAVRASVRRQASSTSFVLSL